MTLGDYHPSLIDTVGEEGLPRLISPVLCQFWVHFLFGFELELSRRSEAASAFSLLGGFIGACVFYEERLLDHH